MTRWGSGTSDDATEIARVQSESWEGVYRSLIPDSLFERFTTEVRAVQWTRFYELAPERSVVLVAETDNDQIVGMAALGPARDDDLDTHTVGEIRAIYVEPRFWDRGYGKQLMVAALEWMGDNGFAEASLWVLDTNRRGRSFYESGGWKLDGATKVDDSFSEPLNEVRYRVDLIPA